MYYSEDLTNDELVSISKCLVLDCLVYLDLRQLVFQDTAYNYGVGHPWQLGM